MSMLSTILLVAFVASPEVEVSPGVSNGAGLIVHNITSPYQPGETDMRVLVPDKVPAGQKLRVVYVLPVEPKGKHSYGDGIEEVRKLDLHNKYGVIFVAPSFAQVPWFGDHATDPSIRQETYFVQVVVPAVEKLYPALAEPRGRLLLGFSKSGWGAWSLLLRHPDVFGRAVAWDAPLMMTKPGLAGSKDIFGTDEQFADYSIPELLRTRGKQLGDKPRLMVTGWDKFKPDTDQVQALLGELEIPHEHRDGPRVKHEWPSGWVPEAVELLLAEPKAL